MRTLSEMSSFVDNKKFYIWSAAGSCIFAYLALTSAVQSRPRRRLADWQTSGAKWCAVVGDFQNNKHLGKHNTVLY